MHWHDALSRWTAWLTAAGRPRSTIKLRLYQMRRFAADNPAPWAQTLEGLIDWLADKPWSTETRRSYRAALRSFYGWAHATDLCSHNPSRMLPSIKPSKRRPRPTPERAVAAGLAAADERTRLMILLAARQGLRRGEICRIHSDDLTEDLGGWSLRVHGKGDKQRVIPLHEEIAAELRRLPPGWAFPGQVNGHLSPRWVGDLVQRALPAGWTTHTLRHRFATVAYHGSRDLLAVQELLGHSKPETTRMYVQLPDDALRAAMTHAA